MSKTPRIEMVFYVHPWSIHLLEEEVLNAGERNLLIEVATESNLSFLCGSIKGGRKGALPLLTNPANVTVANLGTSVPLIPAPLVLAANPKLSRETLVQSLMALEACELDCDAVYLLVHVYNAADFKPVFPLAKKFHFVWDAADLPSQELVDCTQALVETDSLNEQTWGGFHVVSHWLRKVDDNEDNFLVVRERLNTLAL